MGVEVEFLACDALIVIVSKMGSFAFHYPETKCVLSDKCPQSVLF